MHAMRQPRKEWYGSSSSSEEEEEEAKLVAVSSFTASATQFAHRSVRVIHRLDRCPFANSRTATWSSASEKRATASSACDTFASEAFGASS